MNLRIKRRNKRQTHFDEIFAILEPKRKVTRNFWSNEWRIEILMVIDLSNELACITE